MGTTQNQPTNQIKKLHNNLHNTLELKIPSMMCSERAVLVLTFCELLAVTFPWHKTYWKVDREAKPSAKIYSNAIKSMLHAIR